MSGRSPSTAAVLTDLLEGRDLSEDVAEALMGTLMEGELESSQVAALLVALRAKGEVGSEIAGFVRAMLRVAEPVVLEPALAGALVDTCGTGGDGAGTFNISTVAAVVVAAAGVPVAKHGNRAASSACGSADLLEAWGVAIELPAHAVATTIERVGIGFLFARAFHPAMRHVAPIRAQLGIRTVFNLLGPLSNPAGAPHQIVGVSDLRAAPMVAEALARLGRTRALVFRGDDGLDELTTTTTSSVWEVRDGRVALQTFDPTRLGIPLADAADLRGGGVEENRRIADAVLAGATGAQADVVALNAAAALTVAGATDSLREGLALARAVIADGRAASLRDRWVALSRELAGLPIDAARVTDG